MSEEGGRAAAFDVCSSFTPETVVIAVADNTIVGRVPQASPFCPNIAATPDGTQVWFTLKDTGKTEVFNAQPPFNVLRTIDTGPITNHVNIVRNASGQFAYVTIGGLNIRRVYIPKPGKREKRPLGVKNPARLLRECRFGPRNSH